MKAIKTESLEEAFKSVTFNIVHLKTFSMIQLLSKLGVR
jgi:hypothetical protein